MKRVLSLVFLLCLLVGCNGSIETSPPSQPSQLEQNQDLTLLSFPDQPKNYLEKCLQEAQLDFHVDIIEVPQNQYENKVRMMLSANEAPDLILIDTPNIANYASTGRIVPLDDYWPEESFSDLVASAQAAVTWNGKKWAAPLNEATCVLFYNRELLRKANIIPPDCLEDAWTMDEFLQAAIDLTIRDENGNVIQYGLQPTMFSPNDKVEGMAYTQMLYTWWFGADILSPDGTTATGYFDSEENLEALQFFSDLYNKYQVAPLEEIPDGFVSGKIAMHISGPWLIGTWRDNYPEFYRGSWGVMPLPKGIASACPTGSWNVTMTTQCANKENAWKAIDALTGETGMRIWCNGTGNIAARQSVIEAESLRNQKIPYNIIYDQLAYSSRIRPVTPAYPHISEAIIDCYNSVAFGNSPEDAVRDATNKINQALEDYQFLEQKMIGR